MLLLASIILAFAQPYFLAKDNENASNELYIILDNSFSMQAKGKKGELLKRSVQELLENTPENTRFSLLTNSESFWNTDIKEIQNSLQNLKYSALPFNLSNLITKVKSHKSAFKKDIVIITDALGLEKKQLNTIKKEDSPYFIIPKAEQKNNVAIDSLYINKILDDFYEINVDLSSYGEDLKPIPVSIYNQNKLIAKTLVNIEKDKKTINFTIPKQDFHGYVSIIDNGLSYDNIFYFSISKIKKLRAISIGDPNKSAFLSRIYTSDEFNFNTVSLPSLDYSKLEEQDFIILNELDEIPQALQTTLKSLIKKGSNLIIIPSATTSITNINSFLKDFGSLQFKSFEKKEKLITKINFNHPLFNGVFENKIDNFQYPKTKSSFEMSGTKSAAFNNDDKSAFLTSLSSAVASVYVFSAPLNSENSNFQQSPLIVPTFYKMAINNQNNGINALTIGNPNPYLVDVLLSKDAILTVKNSNEQFIPIQQVLNNKVKLIFNDYPEQAGNFEIYNQKKWLDNISFNYNRTEGNLDGVNHNILSDYTKIESVASFFDTLQSNRTDSQIWKWFLIFALLFLVTEMAVIRFVK